MRLLARCVRALLLLCIAVVLLGLLALVGLYAYQVKNGVPDWVVHRLQSPLEDLGYSLEAEDLKVVSFRGIKGSGLVVGRVSRPDLPPLFTGDLHVEAPIESVLGKRIQPAELEVKNGQLVLDPSMIVPVAHMPPVEVDDVELRAVYRDDWLVIHWLSGDLEGVELNLDGAIDLAWLRERQQGTSDGISSDGMTSDASSATVTNAPTSELAHLLKQMEPYREILRRASFSSPPKIDVTLDMGPGRGRGAADLRIECTGPAVIEGRRVASFICEAEWRDEWVHLRRMEVELADAAGWAVTGRFNHVTEETYLGVTAKGNVTPVVGLLPKPWQRRLVATGARLGGSMDVEATFGPFRPSGTITEWDAKGWFSRLGYRDGTFRNVDVKASQRGSVINATGTLEGGRAKATGTWDTDLDLAVGVVDLSSSVDEVLGWVPEAAALMAEQQVRAEGALSGRLALGPASPKDLADNLSGWVATDFLAVRHWPFSNVRLEGSRGAATDRFSLRANDGRVATNGTFDRASKTIHTTLNLNGDFADLAGYLPPEARDRLVKEGLQIGGTVNGAVRVGPCTVSEIPQSLNGRVALTNVRVRDSEFARVDVVASATPTGIRVDAEADGRSLVLGLVREAAAGLPMGGKSQNGSANGWQNGFQNSNGGGEVYTLTGAVQMPFAKWAGMVPRSWMEPLGPAGVAVTGEVIGHLEARAANPEELIRNVRANATLRGVTVRKAALEKVDVALTRRGAVMEATVRGLAPETDVRAKVVRDETRGEWTVDASADAPGPFLVACLPVEMKLKLAEKRLRFPGRVVSRLQSGPLPAEQLMKSWRGPVEIRGGELNGAWFPLVRTTVAMHPSGSVRLGDVSLEVGRGDRSGTAAGWLEVNPSEKSMVAEVEARAFPEDLKAVFPKLSKVLDTVVVERGPPPRFVVEYADAKWDEKGNKRAKGTVSGRDTLFKGVDFDDLAVRFAYHDEVTDVELLRAVRKGETATGKMTFDNRRRTWTVDAESTIDPPLLGRIGGAAVEKVFRVVDYGGETHVQMKGVIDLDKVDTQLTGTFYGEDVALAWIHLDDCHFRWSVSGDEVAVRDVRGHYLHGDLRATADFESIYDPRRNVKAQVEVERGDLKRFLYERAGGESKLNGMMNLEAGFAAGLGADWQETMKGTGRLEVEGQLFRFPILGGLSPLIGAVIPGFGYTSQTEFGADLRIEDRKVHLKDARLEGGVVLIGAEGWLDFDRNVNARGRVTPPDGTLVGDLLGFVTSPLSMLMDFRVQGTLDKHETKLVHVPKELRSLFE